MFTISFYRKRVYYSIEVATLDLALQSSGELHGFGLYPVIVKGGKIYHNPYEPI